MAVYIPKLEPAAEVPKPELLKEKSDIFSGKREIINGYDLEKGFTTKNSGFSRWGFGKKNGKEYFIKEFLSPVFPDSLEISEETRIRKQKICKAWFDERQRVFKAISDISNGNIVTVKDFFKFGNKFYEVTEKINEGIDLKVISKLPLSNKVMLMKVLAYCMKAFDEIKMVHADIKLDNIIVKRTVSGVYTAKIIDISDCYFESEAPENSEEIKGDFVYLAPESFLKMVNEDAKLTTKIDIFALGIIFHQFMCGKLPDISSEYNYIYEAVLNDEIPYLDESIPSEIKAIIEKMLIKDIDERISAGEVFEELLKLKVDNPTSQKVSRKSGLRINMGGKLS